MMKVLQTVALGEEAIAPPDNPLCSLPFVCIRDYCGLCDGICWVG